MRVLRLIGIFAFVCFSRVSASDRDQTDMEAFYSFDAEADNGNFTNSLSGVQGTLYGAKLDVFGENGVLVLDGRTSFARTPHRKDLQFGGDAFSIDFWIKIDSPKPGQVMGKKGEGIDNPGWLVEVAESGADLRVTLADGSRHEMLEVPIPNPEEWHYVVIVRDQRNLIAYIDGKEAGRIKGDAVGVNVSNESVHLQLGRILGNFRSFQGLLDEVGIWRRALSSDEIKEHYEALRKGEKFSTALLQIPRNATEILHYRFDSDPGGVARDLSGNDHDGKIHDGQYLPGKNGQSGALRFNGTSAYIDIPASEGLGINGDMTFEMWVRQNGPQQSKGAVLFGQAPPSAYLFAFEYEYNVLFSYRSKGLYGPELVSLPVTRKILTPEWTHIAVVVEFPRCRFYLNGQLVRDQYMPLPGVEGSSGRALRLGGEPANDYYAPIDLREFRLYRRALAVAEIAAHAQGKEQAATASAELAVEPNWYKNELTVRWTSKGGAGPDENVTLSLWSDGKEIATDAVALKDVSGNHSGRFAAEAKFALKDLEGKTVEARADHAGKIATENLTLEKPAWIRAKAGMIDKVPPPWTPVKVVRHSDRRLDLEVWGRRYSFDGLLFPSQITAAGAELLAKPSQLLAKIAGKEITWEPGAIELVDTTETGVKLKQNLKGGPATLTIVASLEYDGFLRYRCELSSDKEVEVDRMVLDISFQPERASLCYADRAYPLVDRNYVATFYSGAIDKPLGFQFSPNVWIGDDDRGLTWQVESDQHWNWEDPQKALEIIPGVASTNFLANFIKKPARLDAGHGKFYEFALLATPVKPLKRDAWSLRIARSEPWGKDLDLPDRKIDGKPELQVIADQGVRHLFSFMTDIFPWPMPAHEKYSKALTRLVNEAHSSGIKIYPYVIHQRVPVNVPEFDLYGTNMANRPMKSYSQPIPFPLNPNRPGSVGVEYGADSSSAVFMCSKSEALQDAFVNSTEERLEKYGEDGVYLDGTVHIGPLCFNEDHGCGYRDEQGELHGTYPVFSVRELMKRIYGVVKKHKPEGVVDAHSSFGYNPSALAYTDVMWTGEQWHHLRHTGTDYISGELKMDKFRTEFTGRQLGIASEVLHYRLRYPMKIAATSLLLDVSPRYSTGAYDNALQSADPYFAMIPKLWKMRDEFGMDEAEKLFFWKNQDYVTVTGDKCHATLFKHPKNGVMAIVSNLSREKQDVGVQFNLEKLGLAGQTIRAFNPLTGEDVKLSSGGKINMPLGSEEWRYVRLSPSTEKVAK